MLPLALFGAAESIEFGKISGSKKNEKITESLIWILCLDEAVFFVNVDTLEEIHDLKIPSCLMIVYFLIMRLVESMQFLTVESISEPYSCYRLASKLLFQGYRD